MSFPSARPRPRGVPVTRFRAALLAVCLALPPAAASAAVADDPPLQGAMERALAAEALQGAVWSTVVDGDIEAGAAGRRDARDGAGMRIDERVHVGSVAKPLIATGVLMLVTDGRLALDDPVAAHLPDIAFDNPWAATHPVRVRHLLDHTAGLDDARLGDVFSLRADPDAPLADLFAGRGPLAVRSRPGARHSYSNTGYTLLAMLVETLSGERYEAWYDTRLLAPLGMRDSTFRFTTQAGPHAEPRLAMGHFDDGSVQAAVPIAVRPATQFTTTAGDMGRFARFLLGDGRAGGRTLVAPALLRDMGRPVGTEAVAAGLRTGYGLGLATRDRHGAVGACHGGSTVGFRAMLCVFRDSGRAFFVATNTDREDADYGAIDRPLLDALGVRDAPATAASGAADDASGAGGAVAGAKDVDLDGWYVPAPNRFAFFAGLDATAGALRVVRDGDALRVTPLSGGAQRLARAGPALYRLPDRRLASHAVGVDADGAPVLTTGLQTWAKASTPALFARWASVAAGVAGLAWLLLAGATRLARRRFRWRDPAAIPSAAVFALLLPVPLFATQSFLALGDPTPAAIALAVATGGLPLAMATGLWRTLQRRPRGTLAAVDTVSMLAVLQWCGLLATWGWLPFRLWT